MMADKTLFVSTNRLKRIQANAAHSNCIRTCTQLIYKILWEEGMNLKLMMCAKGHMA